MSQHNANTAFRHIPTEYDSCGLGRDDPIWPRYVAEAAKWDAQLVEGWHKGMDVILLFVSFNFYLLLEKAVLTAALFSAIVTAFLIESYKLLQVDHEETIASGIPAIIGLLQVIAANQTLSATMNATSTSTDFKPTRLVVVMNALWFLSLTLSISVALLAMLVKQWGEGYRHGHDLSPPCIQARVRQARYDELKRWRAEDIVLALPMLMHVSLGLFLLGLMLFLYQLNGVVLGVVLSVVVLTFVLYLATTLMPLFMAFCPYGTPLSSRRLCSLFYRYFIPDHGNEPGQATPSLKCEQEERRKSENPIPDELTVRALEWLIGHSKKTETVDIAVQAISSTILKTRFHDYLQDSGSLVTLLAQKFTAIFNGILDEGNYDPDTVNIGGTRLKDAVLYGKALVNIARYIRIQSISYGNQGPITRSVPGSSNRATRITLMRDQVTAVERGLCLIASSTEPAVACSGVICLSEWYASTGRATQSRDKWRIMLTQLIGLLPKNNYRQSSHTESEAQGSIVDTPMRRQSAQVGGQETDVREYHYAATKTLERDELDRIIHALLLELAHWRWDLSKQERLHILMHPIELFIRPGLLSGPTRPGMSAILAILALIFNEYQGVLTETAVDRANLQSLGPEGDNLSSVEQIDSKAAQPSTSQRRSVRAQCAVRIFREDDGYMLKHSDSLLFFGLAGLLDSFSALGLAEFASEIVELVTTQLDAMSSAFRSGPIRLPFILPDAVDTRIFMADAITRSLSPSPFRGQHCFSEEQKADLLKCLRDKSYIWSDYGDQFLMPTVQLLQSARTIELRSECLTTLNGYPFTNLNPGQYVGLHYGVDWRFFFSLDVPYRLAEIMKENKELRSKVIATFDSIMKMIPKVSPNSETDVEDQISPLMSRLAVDGLLSAFAEVALCRDVEDFPYVRRWRDRLMNLPEWLDSTKVQNAESVKTGLRQFYVENIREPNPVDSMKILVLGVGGKLNLGDESS